MLFRPRTVENHTPIAFDRHIALSEIAKKRFILVVTELNYKKEYQGLAITT